MYGDPPDVVYGSIGLGWPNFYIQLKSNAMSWFRKCMFCVHPCRDLTLHNHNPYSIFCHVFTLNKSYIYWNYILIKIQMDNLDEDLTN